MNEDKIIVDEYQKLEEKEVETTKTATVDELKETSIAFDRAFRPLQQFIPSKHQMSKRGAKHNHKPTFQSREILPMSPAQYRRYHFGKPEKDNGKQEKDNG